jgi:cellulose synthase/poly-beta-1,6-N-acetylglucosamine synthase-like glycosyltransferase
MDSSIKELPYISVLIAARNEELNIDRCVQSLVNQNYDREFEIIIGNDDSSDHTGEKINDWVNKYSNIRLLNITGNVSHQKGKANVLAQLAREARGQYLLITDADVRVNENWVSAMAASLGTGAGIITGVTAVEGDDLFARIQNADWIFLFANGYRFAKRNSPVTACGNNMGISKAVYEEIGGYENIPFSVTEDYELFKQVTQKGYSFKSLFSPKELAFTRPLDNMALYFQQRKRWYRGALQLPFALSLVLVLHSLLLPILVLLGVFVSWKIALGLVIISWGIISFDLNRYYRWLKLKPGGELYLYFPYTLLFSFLFLIYYMLPFPVIWKGRKY